MSALPEPDSRPVLFHEIADPGSAAARRTVVARGLERVVRFRNLVYDEVAADFAKLGGRRAPGLWDGTTLVEGEDAVVSALGALMP